MSKLRTLRRVFLLAVAAWLLAAGPASPQAQVTSTPRPQPVAETRLLMEGINLANLKGLEDLLGKKPADVEAWTFARGQALLIAENGNLLMLRPPRGQGRDAWLTRAAELREAATGLARAAAGRDYQRSRAGLVALSDTCNRCHQSFRVAARFTPFKGAAPADKRPSRPVP
ncbi:MAG TPA: cytochrome c [Gemmataceae bacterium]|jgi:cytochrome c556|nr:cytochrome c [Gemmataceae bacterium]